MLALLGPLGALLGIEAASMKDRLKRQAILWTSVGALGLIAVAFILVAINTVLAYAVGPVIAPLMIAGAAILIGLAIYGIFHFRETMEAKRDEDRKRSAEMTALVTTAVITAIPLILPTLKKVGVPTATAAATLYSLLQSKAFRRDN